MQARYYDPVIGRFLSNDPVGYAEGGVDYFNRYAYTANNPVNFWDPSGLCAVEDGAITGCDIDYGNLTDDQREQAEEALIAIGTDIQDSDDEELQAAWAGTTDISFTTRGHKSGDGRQGDAKFFDNQLNRRDPKSVKGKIRIYGPAFEDQDGTRSGDNLRATVGHELGHGTPFNVRQQNRRRSTSGPRRDVLGRSIERDAERVIDFLKATGTISQSYTPIDFHKEY